MNGNVTSGVGVRSSRERGVAVGGVSVHPKRVSVGLRGVGLSDAFDAQPTTSIPTQYHNQTNRARRTTRNPSLSKLAGELSHIIP